MSVARGLLGFFVLHAAFQIGLSGALLVPCLLMIVQVATFGEWRREDVRLEGTLFLRPLGLQKLVRLPAE